MNLFGVELVVAERALTLEQLKLVLGHESHQRTGAPAHRAIAREHRPAQIKLDLVLDVATVTRPLIRFAFAHRPTPLLFLALLRGFAARRKSRGWGDPKPASHLEFEHCC